MDRGTLTWARLRAPAVAAFVCGAIVAGCAIEHGTGDDHEDSVDSVSSPVVTDQTVYTDAALASGWASWSWSTALSFANTDAPRLTGSTSHIKVSATAAWGALSLAHSASDLTVSDYASISFDVRGPSSSTVSLAIQPLSGATVSTTASIAVTTTWTRKTVNLSSLSGVTKLGKMSFLAASAGQIFYVDNIKLVAKTAADAGADAADSGRTDASPDASDSGRADASDSGQTDASADASDGGAVSSFPVAPITVQKGTVASLTGSTGPYWFYVPSSYDATHRTPTKVLLWMHGCGGNAWGETYNVSPGGSQDWISVSVGGRDNDCWYPDTDVPMVLGVLADMKRRLNVDPRRVVIGGFSSGGDIAYRTAFYNARTFAGLITENTSPFRDTGSSQQASLAAAAWKLNIAHLAHTEDENYLIAAVRAETDAVKAAGFPLTRIERPGTHWQPDTATSGTTYDMRTYLLPYLSAGWIAPP